MSTLEINLPTWLEERVLKTAVQLNKTPSQLVVERLLPAFGMEGVTLDDDQVWAEPETKEAI